ADLIQIISAVGLEGSGNVAAIKAWKDLSSNDATALITIFEAIDSANDLSANWLRSAIETIVSRELARGATLPVADLENFLRNRSHNPLARRLAFELITRNDPARTETLVAGMINDPASELRREAVERELARADRLQTDGKAGDAKKIYTQLLT